MGLIYHYHPITGVYLTSTQGLPDPLDQTKDIVPAHATQMAPPPGGQFTSAVFIGGAWQLKDNYTEMPLYDKATGLPAENKLNVGDPLPAGLTAIDPVGLTYPKWDDVLASWIEDDDKRREQEYAYLHEEAVNHIESALRLLEDNELRKKVPGLRVMEAADESALYTYLQEMQVYLDLLESTTYTGIDNMGVTEPTLAAVPQLAAGLDEKNMSVFTQVNQGIAPGATTVQWQPSTHFDVGSLVYGPQGEGLFVVTSAYTSNPQMQTDVNTGFLVPAVPDNQGLRYAPVPDLATLAGLNAADFAICRVADSGREYVFQLGATVGDVPDNNGTGFWIMQASPQIGRILSYNGQVAGAATDEIAIGVQPFTVTELLVFVNGDLRNPADPEEYTFDAATGVITLTAAMQINDTWRVIALA